MQSTPIPFYLDWTFWAFVASAVAIALSQAPPIRQWFRPGRIAIELADRVHISHMLGFPNVQLYLSLSNVGGRSVRVKKVVIEVTRHGQATCTLRCQAYFATAASTDTVMFLPFNLPAGDEWGHRVNAFEALVAKDDGDLFRLRRALRVDIGNKVRQRDKQDPASTDLVVADESVLTPIMDLFQSKFVWLPGEYELLVKVETKEAKADARANYRFTLYDPESKELRQYADDYKYGFGPAVDTERHPGVLCQLHLN